MKHATFDQPRQRSTEECLYWFPTIAKTANDEWSRNFAQSVMAQSRRRGWRPTDKQLGLMRKMVAQLFTALRDEGDDLQLIE